MRYKAILIQENLNYDELPDKIKSAIQKANSITDTKQFIYKNKDGSLTKRGQQDLEDLDELICKRIDDYLFEKQCDEDRIADDKRLADEAAAKAAAEEEKQKQNEIVPPPPPPIIPPVQEEKRGGLFGWF